MTGPPGWASSDALYMALSRIPMMVAATLMAFGHALAMANMPDIGTIALAVTGIGGAFVGLYVLAIRQINLAKIDAKKAWDEANKDSLSAQMLSMQEDLKKARVSLHEIRDEANSKQLHLQDEIGRLTEELHVTRKLLIETQVEYRKLLETIRLTDERSRRNEERIEQVADDQKKEGGNA